MHRLNLRMVASFAFIVFAFVSFWNSTFTLDVPFNHVIWPRIVQGIGVACFFVPMTTITLSSVSDERLASASGLSNFFRTLSGAIGTAISATYWENDTIYHHAVLTGLGFAGQSLTAQLNQIVTQQAYMMATNDFFRISCAGFIVLAALVWITKPRKGAGPSMGH
jgi:DHA2 family multidrug resistance protein